MTIHVLIADDHSVVRQGLTMFLSLDPDIEIVGQAANGLEAVRLARELSPDVILMDLLMPEMDGVTATGIIRQEIPAIEVIALTSVLASTTISEALQVGAIGYLLKDTEAHQLRAAVKAAAAGQVQLSPEVAARLVRDVKIPEDSEPLTEREIEVLRALTHGLSNQELAQTLYITERTAKTHVSNILSKLQLPSRTHAALYALKVGLVSLDDIKLP
jgi:DNA-binding NarL/FixJ family response regulator